MRQGRVMVRVGRRDRQDRRSNAVPHIVNNSCREGRRAGLLSPEQEQALARRFRDCQDVRAGHELVTKNLRFVYKIAGRYRGYGIDFDDLVQQGSLGLWVAVKKFDPDRGSRLSTYAAWWIRAFITRCVVNTWSLVKVGTTNEQRKLFFSLRSKMAREFGRGQNGNHQGPAVVAQNLGVSTEAVTKMAQRLSAKDLSLDDAIFSDFPIARLDLLRDSDDNPEDCVVRNDVCRVWRAAINSAVTTLTDREYYLVRHRFMSESPETLAQIGRKWGVTRERVRQIELRLKHKLQKLDELRDAAALVA